jgi:hypothetical protein
MTIVLGLLYFPPILQYFFGLESAPPLGTIWYLVQSFVGVALCSKKCLANRKIVKYLLLGNLVYQVVWSLLLFDYVVHVHDRLLRIIPYSLHLFLVILIGLYLIMYHKKPDTSMLN